MNHKDTQGVYDYEWLAAGFQPHRSNKWTDKYFRNTRLAVNRDYNVIYLPQHSINN